MEGIYFTEKKEVAEWFSNYNNLEFVKNIFLNIKKPYISKDINSLKHEQNLATSKEVSIKIKNDVFDGIILDVGFVILGEQKLYLAFYPNQIKSATDNIGSFSSENNNILYQQINAQ